jgi:hypothetical protein
MSVIPLNLLALFLVSLAAVGYETALTRYFAVAKWSEYGYWVISIVMVGFALSGVVLALWRDAIARRSVVLMTALPALLVLSAAAGYHFTTTNPFNPLQLQNLATWQGQLWNIAGYYVALLPFFFLAGLFISLSFVENAERIGRVYAFDLTGAGAGSALTLLAMYFVHAFSLLPLLLVPLALAALAGPRRFRLAGVIAAVVSLGLAEGVLLLDDQAAFNDFKAIYAPMHTPDAKTVASVNTPRGDYTVLDDFTERVDTDISNNAAMMGIDGPPRSYGLYRDGNRIAALPKPGEKAQDYAKAALDAFPYMMIPHARVLLAGASGGFRTNEVLHLGASHVTAVETEPQLRAILRDGIGPVPPTAASSQVRVSGTLPMASAGGPYDIIDLSADFLDAAEVNTTAFTWQAVSRYVGMLGPNGVVSIPVSIRDFPVYALRMLATVRRGLADRGIDDAPDHVVVYRSAWGVRILLSRERWSADSIAQLKRFCDDRSFDISWYPGMDVAAARGNIYNDLPAVSFEKGEVESSGPDDAIADEAEAVLRGRPTASGQEFNLSPISLDRPAFYAVLRLDRISTILKRLELLPQTEVGALVNLAVLFQAVILAALVLLVPVFAGSRLRGPQTSLWRTVLFFPALALGFLFIELYLIEKASLLLGDRTNGFAFVLTGMLIFSGLGSACSSLFGQRVSVGMGVAGLVIVSWSIVTMLWLQPLILLALDWSFAARAALLVVWLAPVSVALGLPFPLGLSSVGNSATLPWAWGLNGAFSVVATPLANLIAREAGFSRVILCAAVLYGIALVTFPATRKRSVWHDIIAPSAAAE